MQTLVSTKYQIVIPKDVRDKLEVQPGQIFQVETQGKNIILSKPLDWPDEYIEELRGLFKGEEIDKYLEKERDSWE